MDKISLKAQDRSIFGKKVKNLRKEGKIPAHVFGNIKEVEHVTVEAGDFARVFKQAGETGLIDLKIGEDRSRPVMIKELDVEPVKDQILHIGFYQVNLKEKVTVPVPIVLIGEEVESVKMGENVVLQNLSEVEVEALPGDLVENIEVNIEVLKNVDDAITVGQLNYDRTKLTVLADADTVVVKLAPAVTEEMKALLEEQQAEAEAAVEAAEGETAEGEAEEKAEGAEGETEAVEGGEEAAEIKKEESPEETNS